MYRISELAVAVGLSRTALLYYEKQQLINGRRLSNGYRIYNDNDLQRIRLIQKLQAGGLTLKECKACLEAKVDRKLLENRLQILDEEIAQKQQSRQLLAAMLGEGKLKTWHESVDKLAPDAHLDWLMKQGFSEKEALRLKWLSKDMNEHAQYMTDFMKVFEALERWAPGSESETLKAISLLPEQPKMILEIGCGKGLATKLLAQNTPASITTVDNEQSALTSVNDRFEKDGLASRLTTVCASMTELPFEHGSFDLIWAEGSAYIMGVSQALAQWKPLLDENGVLMLSDLVWLSDTPDDTAVEFWKCEYPDIQTVATRIKQMEVAGYEVLHHFTLSHQAWQNYYEPLISRTEALKSEMLGSQALQDISRESDIYRNYLGQFGYQMFILRKCD
ncbi:MerR family transcriptional regulator [Shewanella sp. D64]|uniref:MerR family transcriptional regulator n=1 Tax=unclassified Shewanella TaxID=196818 RepID=UPI0022BA5216|nr:MULTISPECIES: MerR family transcriptional regulator [unclassified Shewanella]MEC4727452.1 MerR family transcriptional regulator [Shewanella sp. D64]MEC4738138.1 MerR family transcriptional regulator [Shewanella sp. E94]WBJ96349.1 MerR family transcriptional regulator [Shewanella sp. MTB7]